MTMTLWAALRTSAASSTVPSLYDAPLGGSAAGALASPVPNAPNRTLANERFIAFDIMTDNRKPLDPSSEPAMMRMLFLSAKPVAHAARPAYELRSEMTTGMSAPPMGMTSSTPSAKPHPSSV